MKKTINIPFGSQHIALLEPVRFQFEAKNETIVDVKADVGYVHRGIEKACITTFDYKQIPSVVARVCGLCAITHSLSYVMAVENILNVKVSDKAKYLRMLMLELDRIHSHMLCLAHTTENAGYEALFMKVMADREIIMDMQEIVSGNRVQFDFVCIGGVNRDIDSEVAKFILDNLVSFEQNIDEIYDMFENNWSLSLRYKGIGTISKEDATKYDALGPLARAAGVATDVRAESTYFPYADIGYEMVLAQTGDIYARNIVRLKEIKTSIKMIQNILEGMPEGDIFAKPKGKPEGESVVRLEAPRGEIFYYVKGVKKTMLDRVRIKTPTFSNIPAMIEIFKGEQYADVPAILASFDPCMSCTAK